MVVTLEVAYVNQAAKVYVVEHGPSGDVLLAARDIYSGGSYPMMFVPSTANITIDIVGPTDMGLYRLCFDKLVSEQQTVIVDVCDKVKDSYPYGYNGQEKVNEWAGPGNFLDYKERGLDTRIGRFLSVDKLTAKFPELTPYQFASNTPIQAIDLDGLEAWFVHGTFSDPSTFTAKTSNNIKELFNNSKAFLYQWSGNNSNEARQSAGERLAELVFANRVNGEKITIMGHSHGGNVGIYAINTLINRYSISPSDINLITVNTPVRADFQLRSTLVNHFNIFNNQDAVQIFGGKYFNASRIYGNAINLKYKDQNPESTLDGKLNHFGTQQKNVDIWFPKLSDRVRQYPLRYQSSEKTEHPNKKQNNRNAELEKGNLHPLN